MLVEANFSDVETLTESVGDSGKKNWYIRGIMAQGEIINRNRRMYPSDVLAEAMNNYVRDYVNTNRAVGELSHPENHQINLDKITHLTESIERNGNDYIGKAKILATPCGKIVEALLEGGVKLGVSTRADGKTKKLNEGYDRVLPGMRMKAIDIVFHPSAQKAMMESLMESDQMIWDTMKEDAELLENIRAGVKMASSRDLQEAKLQAFQKLMEHIRSK